VVGDTKVISRGAAQGLFIKTSGVGEVVDLVPLGSQSIRVGDRVLVSGLSAATKLPLEVLGKALHLNPHRCATSAVIRVAREQSVCPVTVC